jgi:hypothetical protein
MMPPDLSNPGKYAGPTLRELCLRELDKIMDTLMDARLKRIDLLDEVQTGLREKASGIALAIAIFTNPYSPNVDAIRAEAVDRWETRQS